MKRRRIALAAAAMLACAVSLSAVQAPPLARAAAPVYQVLSSLQALGNTSFEKVVAWAHRGAPAAFGAFDYQQAEAAINALGSSQRSAVLQWLTGNGRWALYALGVPNSAIGPARPGADSPLPTASPNPWRELQFVTDSLGDPAVPGPIQVSGGFGAARRDGKSVMGCVTFTNTAPQAATSIVFSFSLKDGNGNLVGTIPFVRTGTFSTGIGIHTWDSFSSWNSGLANGGYAANCVTKNSGVAALPIIEARFMTYSVRSVTFADGTTWQQP